MSLAASLSHVRRTPRAQFARLASTAFSAGLLVIACSQDATGQAAAARPRSWEFRVASGALMPVGIQRRDLRSGSQTSAQLSWMPRTTLALTATFGWARSRDLTTVDDPKLNAYTADLGVESHPKAEWFAGHVATFRPFVGFGAGSRSYDYRNRRADATHNLAGYGAVGGELGIGRLGLRVEVRDYVSGYKPLTGVGASQTRNDVTLLTALRLRRRAELHR